MITDIVTKTWSLVSNHYLTLLYKKSNERNISSTSRYTTPASLLPAKLAHNFRPSDLSPAGSIINSATKYHIPSARSFHPPFKRRIFTVVRRPCVETCKYLRRSSRVAHRPFRLTMCTSRSSSYILPSLAAEKNGGPFFAFSPDSRQRTKIRAFTTSSFTRGFRKYFIPRMKHDGSAFFPSPM